MTKKENEAIQFIIWRSFNWFGDNSTGLTLLGQKRKWTLKRLEKLWLKYCDENKI
ncbi:hypothetical protein LCGC14_1822550 [marine sediment metagenome]|uniref:Uncharacterized protein n=1 Tax=marine sediment metagenome TaxID=412755 RepID=A0A0F9GIH0_9ZZZZ